MIAYPVLCVLVLVAGGKPYYALPLQLVLAAAGCVSIAVGVRRLGTIAVGVAAFAVSVVIALPVLPVSSATLVNAVGAVNAEQVEQIGWPEVAASTAAAWQRWSLDERSGAVLLAANYGEAGALDRYGPALGLPPAFSPHMSYFAWGPPPDASRGPVLLLAQPAAGDQVTRHLVGCRQVGSVDNGLGIDNEEQDAVLTLCRRTTQPWSRLWPTLRRYY